MSNWRYHIYNEDTNDDQKRDLFKNKFIVCMQKNKTRKFKEFDKPLDIYNELMTYEKIKRTWFEVFSSSFLYKPYFDIDIPKDGDKFPTSSELFLDKVLGIMEDIFSRKGIQFNIPEDIRVYSSHGPYKRSYHIVLHKFSINHNHMKYLYNEITKNLTAEERKAKYLDPLYKSIQQFRLLFCHKDVPEDVEYRTKILVDNYTFKGVECNQCFEENDRLKFCHSLCSYTYGTYVLPAFFYETSITENTVTDYTKSRIIDTVEESIPKILEIYYDKFPNYPFESIKTQGALYLIKIKYSYICPVCLSERKEKQAYHEHENPFITIANSFGGYTDIKFYCRRAEKFIPIATIGGVIDKNNRELLELKGDKILPIMYLIYEFGATTPRLCLTENYTPKTSLDMISFQQNKQIKQQKIHDKLDRMKNIAD